MDRITKSLRLLRRDERTRVAEVIDLILAGETAGLDVKKLTGYANAYPVRVGTVRIIYFEHKDYNELVFVGRRNEKRYKKF